MTEHAFIFEPGEWIGEGKIAFSASPEHMHFYTKWQIPKQNGDVHRCEQVVEMVGSDEHVVNRFQFSSVQSESFIITLENDLVGRVQGKGVIGPTTIGWEFLQHTGFEGFEVYELQENGDYMLHAEYASPDQFRTIIDGRIWKKES